jgi:hypothetical protein
MVQMNPKIGSRATWKYKTAFTFWISVLGLTFAIAPPPLPSITQALWIPSPSPANYSPSSANVLSTSVNAPGNAPQPYECSLPCHTLRETSNRDTKRDLVYLASFFGLRAQIRLLGIHRQNFERDVRCENLMLLGDDVGCSTLAVVGACGQAYESTLGRGKKEILLWLSNWDCYQWPNASFKNLQN